VSVFLQPIYTQTVGAGGAASVTFNNIPQTFTDLKLVVSSRSNDGTAVWDWWSINFNNDVSTSYSSTWFWGDTSPATSRASNSTFLQVSEGGNAAGATANTFGNTEVYISNYSGSNYKSIISDAVNETNAAGAGKAINAHLWRNTSGITSVKFTSSNSASFVQYSTFSLYGVLRAGI
jgi:hypothetical protein